MVVDSVVVCVGLVGNFLGIPFVRGSEIVYFCFWRMIWWVGSRGVFPVVFLWVPELVCFG
jgi:hypothetical protein